MKICFFGSSYYKNLLQVILLLEMKKMFLRKNFYLNKEVCQDLCKIKNLHANFVWNHLTEKGICWIILILILENVLMFVYFVQRVLLRKQTVRDILRHASFDQWKIICIPNCEVKMFLYLLIAVNCCMLFININKLYLPHIIILSLEEYS